DPGMYLFSGFGLESHHTYRVLALIVEPFLPLAAIIRRRIGERCVERDDKVVFKIARHTTTVFGVITDNPLLFRNYFYIGSVIKSVNHQVCAVCLWIGKPEHRGTFGRRHLRRYVMV